MDAATARSMTEEERYSDNMLADTVMLREVAASRTTITLLLQTLTSVSSNDSVNGYKITESANPRDTSVSLAVCLSHNFQI